MNWRVQYFQNGLFFSPWRWDQGRTGRIHAWHLPTPGWATSCSSGRRSDRPTGSSSVCPPGGGKTNVFFFFRSFLTEIIAYSNSFFLWFFVRILCSPGLRISRRTSRRTAWGWMPIRADPSRSRHFRSRDRPELRPSDRRRLRTSRWSRWCSPRYAEIYHFLFTSIYISGAFLDRPEMLNKIDRMSFFSTFSSAFFLPGKSGRVPQFRAATQAEHGPFCSWTGRAWFARRWPDAAQSPFGRTHLQHINIFVVHTNWKKSIFNPWKN